MGKLLMGIDIGTSSCKICIFNLEGKIISQRTRAYKVLYPESGWVEQDPMDWWEEVTLSIKDMIKNDNFNPKEICAIGVDGQSWSCIPVNAKGDVLYNTPIWMDTRSNDICIDIVNKIGFDEIFKVSGNSFKPSYTTPKILWFKEHKPEVFKNTYKFLQSNSFIVYKLTGEFTQEHSQGYGLHVFNINNQKYDENLADKLEIDLNILPSLYKSQDVVGVINRKASQETGLPTGIPVVAGGLDAACGTLGVGVYKSKQTQEQGGQAGGMSICLDQPISNPSLILGMHVIPNLWLLQGGTVGGGGTINWFEKEFAEIERQIGFENKCPSFQIMDEEAKKISIGSDGLIYLPYMAGERTPIWDKNAKGVFFGLDYSKTRAHFIRSILEGCGYALFHNLNVAKESGAEVDVLMAMGGAANSSLWTQIKSDITGKVIKVPASDTATTFGAAILAGVGTGNFKSYEDAITKTISIKKTYTPNKESHEKYKKYYEIYLEIYEKLKDTMEKSNNM